MSRLTPLAAERRATADGPRHGTTARVRIGEIAIDSVTFDEAIDAIERLVDRGGGGTVYTPNVDHVVLAEEDETFRAAYHAADLSLVDSTPVRWAARAVGSALPAKISGSDLVKPVIRRAAERGWRVYLLGAAPGVAVRAKESLEREFPDVNIVGTSAPMVDLSATVAEQQGVLDAVTATRPHIVFLALGAPKQEIWAHRIRDAMKPAVLIGVGASLDFIAGTAKRAPPWMSEVGVEWLYRLVHEPGRLWKRYLVRDPKFAAIVARQLLSRPSR